MKAMILAAGRGSRLGTLTDETPKCLMEAGGKTLLEMVIERLKRAGVAEIVINLHYLGDKVEAYLREHKFFGAKMELSWEETLLDTGGGLYKVRDFFKNEELFLVHNCDIFTELDLSTVVAAHRAQPAVATLPVMQRSTSRYLVFDGHSQLIGWRNTKTDKSRIVKESVEEVLLAFSGMHVMSPRIFSFMEGEAPSFSIMDTYMKVAASDERVLGFRIDESFWIDIGTPASLEKLRKRLK